VGVSFVCPKCSKPVDPTSSNAVMTVASKQWQHLDCNKEPRRKVDDSPRPDVERRRKPRR
jgi:hypothetical protein